MLKQFAIAATFFAVATAAPALDMTNVEKSFLLKDGSSVHIFKDGKMAMEDNQGRIVPMKPGQVMQTKDGQTLVMVGNELARLDWVRKAELGGK